MSDPSTSFDTANKTTTKPTPPVFLYFRSTQPSRLQMADREAWAAVSSGINLLLSEVGVFSLSTPRSLDARRCFAVVLSDLKLQ
jgi:hypothetical protein